MFPRLLCVVAWLCACAVLAHAQLTFTSSWGGKRAAALALNCRNDDALAAVYKLIQSEAEKLLFCSKS